MDTADHALIARLQDGLPLSPHPYQIIGEACGLSEDETIERIAALCRQGVIRRLGARVGHLQAGIEGNIMVVWQVPPARVEEVGQLFAAQPAISHCYERERQPEFPYNLYTMVHAPNPEAARRLIQDLSELTGLTDFVMLPTVRELKKTSPRYTVT